MKICVAGLGRSGTKAIYTLLQSILADHYKLVDYIYEPFLWDKETFNGRFEEVKNRFVSMDSVSYEGIWNHLSIPLFVKDTNAFIDNSFLKRLLLPGNDEPILAKFIRANGRLKLLKEICPGLKFVFILRNPLDNIHSILNRFSFFGGEFHKDDYNRFISEVSRFFPEDSLNYYTDTLILRELQFWYFMNFFALNTIRTEQLDAICISLEDFSENTSAVIRRLCTFLGFDYRSGYETMSREKVGVVTGNFDISSREFEHISAFLDRYRSMLDEFGIESTFNRGMAEAKYHVRTDLPARTRYGYGVTPIMLARELRALRTRQE